MATHHIPADALPLLHRRVDYHLLEQQLAFDSGIP